MHTQCRREEIETSANCCRSPKWGKSYSTYRIVSHAHAIQMVLLLAVWKEL